MDRKKKWVQFHVPIAAFRLNENAAIVIVIDGNVNLMSVVHVDSM